MEDEKWDPPVEAINDYTVTVSAEEQKISIRLQQNSNKQMYQQSFIAEDLQKCGFNKKQSSKFDVVQKLIEMAQANKNGFQCSVKAGMDRNTEGKSTHFVTMLISKDDDICPIEIEMKLLKIKREKVDARKDHIYDLKRDNVALKKEVNTLTQQLNKANQGMTALTHKLQVLEAEVQTLKTKNNANEMKTINLALQNNWRTYGSVWDAPKAFKIGQVVYLKGLVTGGADGTDITTLPNGWRPSKQRLFCSAQHQAKGVRVDIRSNGTIYPEHAPSAWVPLDGIQFVVD